MFRDKLTCVSVAGKKLVLGEWLQGRNRDAYDNYFAHSDELYKNGCIE